MFSAQLRLVSDTKTAADITEALGVHPDDTRHIGERRHGWSPPASHHIWLKKVKPDGPTMQFDELTDIIQNWGAAMAKRLGTLSQQGVEVQISVLQDIKDKDDPMERGIILPAGLIRWLAAAGASLDIDQYID